MAYNILMSFYEGNTLHQEGSSFEHSDDDYVQKLLEDGNIVEGEADPAPVNPQDVPAPVAPPVDPPVQQDTPVSQPQDGGIAPPTQEQLAADFQAAGAPTSPVVPPQQ